MILVTGGAGFIGSNFVLDWLARHDEPVLNLDALTYAASPANLAALQGDARHVFVHGDVRDRPLLDKLLATHRPRAVLHLAAESHVDRSIAGPATFIGSNVLGTGTLLEAVPAGPVGRWDRANTLHVEVPDGAFASLPEGQVLSGGNLLLLETEAGWEMVQFRTAALTGPEEWILSGLLRGQQGSVSAAAPAGARVLLLDGSDAVAAVSADEIGSELTWRAAGADDGTVLAFEDRGGLPWPVAHLQAADGTLSWTRRGADLPESWALPEGDNTGRFAVSFDMGSGFGDAAGVAEAAATIPSGAVAARVAEIGADGRIGPWVSIGLGTP